MKRLLRAVGSLGFSYASSAARGPTDLKKLSHTFLLRELLQVGRAAGSAGRVGERTTPDSLKESTSNFVFSGAKWQGAFQLLQ